MLINNPKNKQGNVEMSFLRNVIIILTLFNISLFGAFKLMTGSTSNPITEAKLIDHMVVYHFMGSFFICGGMLVSTVSSLKKED